MVCLHFCLQKKRSPLEFNFSKTRWDDGKWKNSLNVGAQLDKRVELGIFILQRPEFRPQ